MIIPDINLLIYAYDSLSPFHKSALTWWEETVNSGADIGLPWVVVLGFIRLTTNRKVFQTPLTPEASLSIVEEWFDYKNVTTIDPGPKHFTILKQFIIKEQLASNLTTDAHIAAFAAEFRATIYSNDTDFERFEGVRVVNPI